MIASQRKSPADRHNPRGHKANDQHSNSTAAQRQRVAEALRKSRGGCTTIELRRDYDVMMPAARIHELRWVYCLNIQTLWDLDTSESGNRHRVARYVLQPGVWQGMAA